MKHFRHLLLHRLGLAAAAGVALAFCTGALCAQDVPVTGSRNVAVADPAVPRPATKPCVVTLFSSENFGSHGNNQRMDAIPHTFAYRPPTKCKGPWAKVVLIAHFSVDPGYQYDRTASIWLDGVNLYFGTTEEPSPGVGPSWQVERDLTDLSPLLRTPSHGKALINNWLAKVRTSVIHASARLLFYPADTRFPAPRVPDEVMALNGTGTTPAKLENGHSRLSRRIVFPRNTTRVYLDVLAEPQSEDEFYYTCLEDKLRSPAKPPAANHVDEQAAQKPQTCGGGSFREAMVGIDGHAAGLVPIAPWVFTGGMDPFLWRPTPGAQTLNFMPYRVDLTPFAGLLSDGKPHTVSVWVLDAHDYFSVAATLLVYRDRHAQHTGGALVRNTLQQAAIRPTVISTLGQSQAPGVNGDVLTRAHRHYVIEGFVDTSHGRVQTRVDERISFDNLQQYTTQADRSLRQWVRQTARVVGTSSRTGPGSHDRHLRKEIDYTLTADTTGSANNNASHQDYTTTVQQDFDKHILQRQSGLPFYQADVSNRHAGSDHLTYNPKDRTSFRHDGQTSVQTYAFSNSLGDCYRAEVQARNGKVARFTRGLGCLDGKQAMHWFVHPDGAPSSFGWRGTLSH